MGVAGGPESGVIGVVERGIKYSFIEPRLIAQGRPKCYLSCEGRDIQVTLFPSPSYCPVEELSVVQCDLHLQVMTFA